MSLLAKYKSIREITCFLIIFPLYFGTAIKQVSYRSYSMSDQSEKTSKTSLGLRYGSNVYKSYPERDVAVVVEPKNNIKSINGTNIYCECNI